MIGPATALIAGIIVVIPAPPGAAVPLPTAPAVVLPAPIPQTSPPALALPEPAGRPLTAPAASTLPLPELQVPEVQLPQGAAATLPQVDSTVGPLLGGGAGLDMRRWKLQLPVGSQGKVDEVARPRPGDTRLTRWFSPTSTTGGQALTFRAPVNGVTTSGSKNPRSELRELNDDGSKAAWSSTSGTHTLKVVEAFTRLPTGKPHLVGAQIHDDKDDISVFRLEGSNLYVTNGDNAHYKLITSNYQLGTPFEAKFVVTGGRVHAFYNGQQVASFANDFTGAYFKAGAYTQANCSNASPCSSDNYGETTIYDLQIDHTTGAAR